MSVTDFGRAETIWLNGKLVPWDEAKIHVLSHALHYGTGVFEGLRCYETANGRSAIFRLDEHLKRMYYSAQAFEMGLKYTPEQFKQGIIGVIKANQLKACYVRPIMFLGYGKMGLDPHGAEIDAAIAAWPWEAYLGERSVRVKVSSFLRIHPQSTIADAKITGHYVNSAMASLEAHREGFDEALLLDFEGYVAEGPGENIFMVKDNILYTPPLGRILEGVTRSTVITLAKELNLEVVEKLLTLRELKDADECFFSGTATQINPIAEIDDTKMKNANGPVTKALSDLYLKVVRGEIEEYHEWLTWVV